MHLTDVMVDIETTGTNVDYSAIIQIAGVMFNHDTGEIGPIFDRCLAIAPNRFWDEDTRSWWQGQNRTIFTDIVARMEDPGVVINDFVSWVSSANEPLRFWAKPVTFDYPILASYCRQFGLPMPFHYRVSRDLNTYIAARAGGAAHIDMDHIPADGMAHNALADCVYQLRMLFAARDGQWAGSVQDAVFEECPA
jgi:hypothetical protein